MNDFAELRAVLLAHARRYPQMQPQDAVKLLYQNEFGGGHLIADPQESLRRLEGECAGLVRNAGLPLFEDIGGGLVRVNLAARDEQSYPLERLNRDFVRSAALHRGEKARFLEKLALLRAFASEGAFGFTATDLESYLTPYITDGCPMVSHTETYRAAYAPAYRVILKSTSLPALLMEIRALAEAKERVLVAIDGRCASGKSTLAARLARENGWSLFHMDDYFLRPEQRTPDRYAAPGENVDHERFYEEVMRPLHAGAKEIVYRPFDCARMAVGEAVTLRPQRVALIEGSYSCHPSLWDMYDLRVFLTVDPELQLARIKARNGEAGLKAFRERWIPLEEKYFAAYDVERRCDYALDGGELR